MKLHCKCKRCVGHAKEGSLWRRKGTEFVCRECYDRLQAADAVARMARNEVAKMPEFFKDIFK